MPSKACFFCRRTDLVAKGAYTRMTIRGRLVVVCDVCRERGDEAEGRDRR
jgi:hypothetical protein